MQSNGERGVKCSDRNQSIVHIDKDVLTGKKPL